MENIPIIESKCMNPLVTTLPLLTASVLFGQTLKAAEPSLQSLEERLATLETRLISLEAALKDGASYAYKESATREATMAGVTVPAAESATGAVASGQTYVIQDGDTLGKIAAKFGVERKALLEVNRLSEGQPIYIGETLMIPSSAGVVSAPVAPAQKETVTAPAPAAGVVADAGKSAPIPAKQEAKVVGETKKPAPASVTTHTVIKGDTLTSLAKKYGTTVESLKAANGLRTDVISLGQKLKIPAGKETSVQASASAAEPAPKGEESKKGEQVGQYDYDNPLLRKDETYGYYTVVKGDNLYALARDFFTTMPELQRINNMGSSTVIRPGDEIIVPTSEYNAYHKTGQLTSR